MHAARKGGYSATSPDELALVNAAREFGVEFKHATHDPATAGTEPNADGGGVDGKKSAGGKEAGAAGPAGAVARTGDKDKKSSSPS